MCFAHSLVLNLDLYVYISVYLCMCVCLCVCICRCMCVFRLCTVACMYQCTLCICTYKYLRICIMYIYIKQGVLPSTWPQPNQVTHMLKIARLESPYPRKRLEKSLCRHHSLFYTKLQCACVPFHHPSLSNTHHQHHTHTPKSKSVSQGIHRYGSYLYIYVSYCINTFCVRMYHVA